MKRKMIPAADWGATLDPPVGPVQSRVLARRVRGSRFEVIEGRAVRCVPEGAVLKRLPRGWKKGVKRGGKK